MYAGLLGGGTAWKTWVLTHSILGIKNAEGTTSRWNMSTCFVFSFFKRECWFFKPECCFKFSKMDINGKQNPCKWTVEYELWIRNSFFPFSDFVISHCLQLTNRRGKRLACSHYVPVWIGLHGVYLEDQSTELILKRVGHATRIPCVVYLHGNSGCRLDADDDFVDPYLDRGVSVFSFDFSGCGESDGDFVTLGFRQVYQCCTLDSIFLLLPFASVLCMRMCVSIHSATLRNVMPVFPWSIIPGTTVSMCANVSKPMSFNREKEDVECVTDHLSRLEWTAGIALYGRSMGAAAAAMVPSHLYVCMCTLAHSAGQANMRAYFRRAMYFRSIPYIMFSFVHLLSVSFTPMV